VLSVDHHPLFREGIAAIVSHQPDMVLVSQASGGREAIRQYREHRPDITIMDVRLPDLAGIDALTAIREEFPAARIIMFSSLEGRYGSAESPGGRSSRIPVKTHASQ
jgi:DNA-binding NarL/FixJ family response regulator